MSFLPPRPNMHLDQMAAEEFGEPQPQQNQFADAQARENRILSSVENRLQKANYYRLVLENPLFSDGEHEIAYEVEAEFRNFALERLQILMGERPERSELDLPEELIQVLASFTPVQLQATKLWAEKMIERDPNIQRPQAPAAPKLNPVQAQPAAPSLNVVKTEKKPRARKAPKIEPRKPSPLAAAAQQVRQVQPAPQLQPRIQPRQPAPQMPAPTEVLQHFQAPVAPVQPVAQHVQQPALQKAEPTFQEPAPQPQPQFVPSVPVAPPQQAFSNPDDQQQAEVNAQGGLVDHLGRAYEIREYVDHRTGETKKHKVYFNSQIFPKGNLAKELYMVPSEKSAIAALADKDTQGASMVMRTGPNVWDKTVTSTSLLGGALAHFQSRNRNVVED